MRFGRRSVSSAETVAASDGSRLAGDIKLFAGTFVAGFLFVSILIG